MLAFGEKNLGPPPTWQEQNVLETNSPNNTMNSIDSSTNGITRRNFMKKTALTAGAVTLLGQGVGLAQGSSSPVWWTKFQWSAKGDYQVDGTATDDVATTVIPAAIAGRHSAAAGTWVEQHKQQGGNAVQPFRYSAESGSPTATFANGKWIVVFPAGFVYRETRRD